MKALNGPISDRLRSLFPKGDKAWTPQRSGAPAKTPPVPKGVSGTKMTGRKKS